jgi:prepilin-type N-terminal cleavage/methylation domain-containing protein
MGISEKLESTCCRNTSVRRKEVALRVLYKQIKKPIVFMLTRYSIIKSDGCPSSLRRGFTLVELLVVMSIITILTYGASMAISGLSDAGNITEATSEISGILEQSRAFAMANDTYVYLGFDEVNGSASSVQPGVGRVVASAVASLTGTAPTGVSNISSSVQPISKLYIFKNLHLGDLGSVTSGNMERSSANTVVYNDSSSGTPHNQSEFSFTWPLNGGASTQYTFNTVFQIDPQGVVCFVPSGATGSGQYIVPLIELGLQQTHGEIIPNADQTTGGHNFAAIQVQGITGRVQIYRP